MIFSTLTNEQLLRYFRDTSLPSAASLQELLERFKDVSSHYEELTEVLANKHLSYERASELENALEDMDKKISQQDNKDNELWKVLDYLRDDSNDHADKLEYAINKLEEVL